MTDDHTPVPTLVRISEPAAVAGHCWSVMMPLGVPPAEAPGWAERLPVGVLEEGVALGPPGASREDIIGQGGGRFRHQGRYLSFSTSDNTDPRTNGRRYELVLDPTLVVHTGRAADQAAYAIAVAERYLALFHQQGIDVGAATVLEIGPGDNLGAQLLLADHCQAMIVADRFLTPWREAHDAIYRHILAGCGRAAPHLERALGQRSVAGVLGALAEPAEHLTSLADVTVDVVFSNAVIEHVADLPATLRELRRVSRPGAWHFHQIDLRDHRCFTRPLDHLLLSTAAFDEARIRSRCERGCQWRVSDILAALTAAGFGVVEAVPDLLVEERYFAELLPRLRASGSPYAERPEADLRVIAVFLVLRVPATATATATANG